MRKGTLVAISASQTLRRAALSGSLAIRGSTHEIRRSAVPVTVSCVCDYRRGVAFGIAFLALAHMDGFAVMALVLVASTYLPRT